MDQGRFDRLQASIDRLEIMEPCTIEDCATTKSFTMIYASDAISRVLGFSTDVSRDLSRVAAGLEQDGLLYATNGSEIDRVSDAITGASLIRDEKQTGLARELEQSYSPTVYRKI